MKTTPYLVALGALLIACNGNGPAPATTEGIPAAHPPSDLPAWQRLDLPILADNVRHDTLLVHTTHDLGGGKYLMAAQNNNYNRDGIRLYLYRARTDSSAEIIAASKPGYDSETMLPTFFRTADPADGLVVITNMGERQSWGQEAFWVKDNAIMHLGFIDVAERAWKTIDDSTFQFRKSIAPRTLVNGGSGVFEFSFSGDSVQLYDDLQGRSEVMLPADAVRYRYQNGWRLWLNGRPVEPPPAG